MTFCRAEFSCSSRLWSVPPPDDEARTRVGVPCPICMERRAERGGSVGWIGMANGLKASKVVFRVDSKGSVIATLPDSQWAGFRFSSKLRSFERDGRLGFDHECPVANHCHLPSDRAANCLAPRRAP